MTDIEQKALELVNAVRTRNGSRAVEVMGVANWFNLRAALIDSIEAHEADKASHAAELREQAERFSEAVTGFWNYCKTTDTPFPAALSPFILAKPDPLVVEAVAEMLNLPMALTDEQAAHHLRDALDARGLAIVKKEAVNG